MIEFFGYAFGLAGSDNSTNKGPETIRKSNLIPLAFQHKWSETVSNENNTDVVKELRRCSSRLKQAISKTNNKFFVFGGDHSSAITTIQAAKAKHNNLKILWIDAHMDLHTMTSSHSKNIHGMPLATALGQADCLLKTIYDKELEIQASDVCLFGVRSYEAEEKSRLEKLGINILYMDEIKQIGLAASWHKALEKLKITPDSNLLFSIDLDAFDPIFAPAVTVPEPGGIDADDFCQTLSETKHLWQNKLVAGEIVEFSPINDKNQITEKLIFRILNCLFA